MRDTVSYSARSEKSTVGYLQVPFPRLGRVGWHAAALSAGNLPALLKAVEVLTETRYLLDDKRQHIVLDAAQAVDRRAKSNPDLVAKYEKTRAYRSAVAKKAVKTKEKNAAGEQAPGAENGVKPEPNPPAIQ
jgi:hypothetical protein